MTQWVTDHWDGSPNWYLPSIDNILARGSGSCDDMRVLVCGNTPKSMWSWHARGQQLQTDLVQDFDDGLRWLLSVEARGARVHVTHSTLAALFVYPFNKGWRWTGRAKHGILLHIYDWKYRGHPLHTLETYGAARALARTNPDYELGLLALEAFREKAVDKLWWSKQWSVQRNVRHFLT